MTEPYSPWAHVQGLSGVLVAYDDLEHADSYWEPDERVILLDKSLDQRGRRSCLAHELAHLDRGDEACVGLDADRQSIRQEKATDLLAACRLIPLEALAEALVWAFDFTEAGEHLHVDQRTVRARILGLTPDEKKYIESRIAAKEEVA